MENFNGPPAAFGQASSGPRDPVPPRERKSRQAITDLERKDLRVHKQALMQENGKWTTSQMVDFFRIKYNKPISQSTISQSLSDKFKHLDEEDQPLHPDSKKQRKSYWPDLDAAVFDWQQQMLKKKTTVTNEKLKNTAKEIFDKLPQYQDRKVPRFSNGWLEGYQARYNVQKHIRDGESDVGDRAVVEAEFEGLRENLKAFRCEDIYNMDETALFWKMRPDDTLASESKAGGKLERARITVNLACNFTGTRKLPPWFIGKAQTPRCFDRSGVHVENFPMVWRHNGKAWMTAVMFEEYIQWFDRQMAGRKVCLLIDEISAHKSGVMFLSPEGLANTTILFLPNSITSLCQPLDQGIVRSWKAHYRRKWLTYMCNEYSADRDPMKSMNVLQAVRWGIAAWEEDVTPTTIQDCWVRSHVLGPKYRPQTKEWKKHVDEDDQIFNDTVAQMEQQIESLSRQKRIKSAMNIATFVNPVEEIVDDNGEDLTDEEFLESLVEIYGMREVERDHETDEEDVAVDPIEEEEALELLSRLRLYEEQQKDGDKVVMSHLKNYERDIRARLKDNRSDGNI